MKPKKSGASESTLTDSVWLRIRQDVLTGKLAPGHKLTLETLKASYGVSFGPLREALWRLSAERLVNASSRKGFHVSGVDPAELADITRLRILFEGMAVEESISCADDAWEARIISSFHRLSKVTKSDGKEWEAWHMAFHDAIVSNCRSPVLMQLRSQLNDLSYRYRRIIMTQYPDIATRIATRDDLPEHRAIMEACLAKSPVLVKQLLTNHFSFTATMLIQSFGGEG
ncbi:MAG: hypothetical protein DI601_21265 [Azospirillum brasilense]|nr:MAG: hypothetical protein DI601_21265 [Azospirillum brasilense]